MKIFGYRVVDIINPIKWKRVYDSIVVKNHLELFGSLQVHITEQLMWRRLNCPECVEAGKCLACNCPIEEKMFTPEETCTNGLWGPFLDATDWEAYKKEFKINYILKSKFHKNG